MCVQGSWSSQLLTAPQAADSAAACRRAVTAVALTADDRSAYSTSKDGSIFVTDTETGTRWAASCLCTSSALTSIILRGPRKWWSQQSPACCRRVQQALRAESKCGAGQALAAQPSWT